MPKLTIYNAPTSNNSNRAIISIPDSIQLNENIPTINLNQSQATATDSPLLASLGVPVASKTIVPDPAYSPPTFSGGLFGQMNINSTPVSLDANKSVQVTNLLPGASISGVMQEIGVNILPYIEINRVQMPSGFVPLEDLTPYENYSYNTANSITGGRLNILPGQRITEVDVDYNLEVNGNYLIVKGSEFVDSVQIDWLNLARNDGKSDWTTLSVVSLKEFQEETENYTKRIEWKKSGTYLLRIVPMHKGYPLPGYKTLTAKFNIPQSKNASWTSLQLDKNRFRLRLEGSVSQDLNYLEIYEGTKLLANKTIIRNSEDYVATDIEVNDVSKAKFPTLSVYWYKKDSLGTVYYYEETVSLARNFAKESVELEVKSEDNENFTFIITDPNKQLYQPISQIEPFTGTQWDKAIRSKKLMAYIEIIRHQKGDVTNLGHYPVNITQNSDNTSVIEGSPFKFVSRNGNNHELAWSETQEFRQLANVATADPNKDVVYEFRMVFWTAGIEQCIKSNEEYIYLVEPSFDVNGSTQTHRYAYNVWTFEHPSYKYTNLHASKISADNFSHVRYGRSYKATTVTGKPPKEEKTKNINTETLGWQVLYYIDNSDDEVKQFPFFSFNIIVPATTLDSLDRIEVKLSGSGTIIGTYHPMSMINVVDFLGYYEHLRHLMFSLDTSNVFAQIQRSRGNQAVPTPPAQVSLSQANISPILIDTRIKEVAAKRLSNVANISLSQRATQENIGYEIKLYFRDGGSKTERVKAYTASIPKIPEESRDNISFTIGNPVINPIAMNVPASFETSLTNAIDTITTPNTEILENTSSIVTTVGSFGVFR